MFNQTNKNKIENIQKSINNSLKDVSDYDNTQDIYYLKNAYLHLNNSLLMLRNYCIDKLQNINKTNFKIPENITITQLNQDVIRFDFAPIINFRVLKKYEKEDKNILKDAVQNNYKDTIRTYITHNQIHIKKEKMCLCIFNIASKNSKDSAIPDTDNRHYQDFINLIKTFFLRDDNFKNLSIYLDTVKTGNADKTIAYLLPADCLEKYFSFLNEDITNT